MDKLCELVGTVELFPAQYLQIMDENLRTGGGQAGE